MEQELTFTSIGDLLKMDFETELNKKIYISHEYITINLSYEYDIKLDRLNTCRRILKTVRHLSGKTWMTTEVLSRFIELVTEYHHIDLYSNFN